MVIEGVGFDQGFMDGREIHSININYCLKVPERHEKCLRGSSSIKGKLLPTPPSGREWATSQTANVEGDGRIPKQFEEF